MECAYCESLIIRTKYFTQGNRMPQCPNCKRELEETDSFCKYCGTKLTGVPENQTKAETPLEDEVENAVIRRLDGIKNRDEAAVRALIDERYSKFDDWPPFARQEAAEALKNEFGAFKVLSNYSYELKDFEATVLGDVAVATFHIHYQGVIRDKPFEITSRVTSVLRKEESGWKVVHEHFSRFPEETRQQLIASPTPQSTTSPSPQSQSPARDNTRTYAIVGFISALLSLLIVPEILGPVAIILGAYAWRKKQGNLGITILILGIIFMLVGIYSTALG
jgi:ketosteroid isomerase-like protein